MVDIPALAILTRGWYPPRAVISTICLPSTMLTLFAFVTTFESLVALSRLESIKLPPIISPAMTIAMAVGFIFGITIDYT
jgi:hypothetical protein